MPECRSKLTGLGGTPYRCTFPRGHGEITNPDGSVWEHGIAASDLRWRTSTPEPAPEPKPSPHWRDDVDELLAENERLVKALTDLCAVPGVDSVALAETERARALLAELTA